MKRRNVISSSNGDGHVARLVVRYGLVDRVMGVALSLALPTCFFVLNSTAGRSMVAAATAFVVYGTLQAFARRIVLLDDRLLVRDVLWRTRSFSYSDVTGVSLDPQTVFLIALKGGSTIRFPARAMQTTDAYELLKR